MLINALIIVGILIVLVGIVLYYKSQLDKSPEEEEVVNEYSIEYLTEAIAKVFADAQKENLKEMNLTKRELEQEQRKKRDIRVNLKDASHGDAAAKRYIKSFIMTVLQEESFGISPETIDETIHFNRTSLLTTRDKVGIILYLYYRDYRDDGFAQLMKDYNLAAPKNISIEEETKGSMMYDVTAEDIDAVYEDLMSRYTLSYDDKMQVLTQRIFEDYKGFGPIDMLFDFAIDEIEGGVNGIAKGYAEVNPETMSDKFQYSYESVYVVYKGINIKLSCMSFGSQKELIRVCKNIYKFQTAHALSRSEGHVVATMRDGSRVAVARPPEASSWSFCVRKFDSVSSTPTPEELFGKQENCIIPITLLKWIMHTQRSVVFSGGMGTGKTTSLKSCIGYIPSSKNIRVYELSPELNLQRSFPQRNIVSFAVTESTSMQDLYDFGKKFNANINIISETASAEMGVICVESARVGSEQAITTHHATTTENFITALRDNLTSAGGYSDEVAAEEVVVNAFNFDVHMGRIGGVRFIERITEIIPIRDRRYPGEVKGGSSAASAQDTLEFYKRSTDRKCYTCVNICEFNTQTGRYEMKNPISAELQELMYYRLPDIEKNDFVDDMDVLKSLI